MEEITRFRWLSLSYLFLILVFYACEQPAKPRVFVFTDINIDAGDPDDRQSLVHLLWYADELDIVGIVPDRWEARGLEACHLAINAYEEDFYAYKLYRKEYPDPGYIRSVLATGYSDAMDRFIKAASVTCDPLYVLVWGNMINFRDALRSQPGLAANIKLITIGTGLMFEEHIPYLPADWEKTDHPCTQYNWNGFGRNAVFNEPRFDDMWWLEINWTYEGMFSGNEPTEMFDALSEYGALGRHIRDVTKNEPWAQYFRVGDTPSVLYVIDPRHDRSDPTKSTWAGKFFRPLPEYRPNYYTDHHGDVEWDYQDPCNTWENHVSMHRYARGTLETERPSMYRALLDKLDRVYGR